ncbi:MAG: magnesium and cobalt transport protein CorA [Methanomicrobiales archaeon HGW-Methanomicrobiales-3]|jgi:magnesium transporter|nr:MAG: magnesium and cobalt transport protein CorA [Methanomicrobiales archaeon HGW-Methanomicrobiales-3]
MSRYRHKLTNRVGLPPGTLHVRGEPADLPVPVTILDYNALGFSEKPVTDISECIRFRDTDTVTWINVDGLGNPKLIEDLGKCFGIHPLILEDIFNTSQRPKMEDLDQYIYLNLKVLTYLDSHQSIKIEHISMVLGSNFLLSFQEDIGDVFNPVRERIRKDGRIRKAGPDYLAYSLIDCIVDNYFMVMEKLEEQVENLEEELVTNPTRESLQKINRLKKDMIFLRKSVWPLRELINNLERSESPVMQESTRIYLRDVYDHTVQVIDTLETFRDMVSGMIDIYLSGLSYKMNEIMKVLTLIATIFIPLTFVVGLYGMNFKNMPEIEWEYGYYSVLVVMVVMVVGMLAYYRKKKWI